MPLYAIDDDQNVISAAHADEFKRYHCLECRGPMQKRAGKERKAHFYHLHTTPTCRLHSRSIDHLVLQSFLKENNPCLEIEKPFKKILRVADLCWEEKKIVFEIQCSPIEDSAAKRRMSDYADEGYSLIWLLDDRLYNRRQLRTAEISMRHASYYFTLAKSQIYDQFDIFLDTKRIMKGPKLPIDLLKVRKIPITHDPWPQELSKRTSSIYFCNDLIDRSLRYPQYLEKLMEFEQTLLSQYNQQHKLRFFIKKYLYIGLEFLIDWAADPNTSQD
jgi:competence protein CoiA